MFSSGCRREQAGVYAKAVKVFPGCSLLGCYGERRIHPLSEMLCSCLLWMPILPAALSPSALLPPALLSTGFRKSQTGLVGLGLPCHVPGSVSTALCHLPQREGRRNLVETPILMKRGKVLMKGERGRRLPLTSCSVWAAGAKSEINWGL